VAKRDQTLGQALRSRREHLGQSQAEAAELLRTTQGNVSRWERDLSEPRDAQTYWDLSAYLGIPLRQLAELIAQSALQRALREIAQLQSRSGS